MIPQDTKIGTRVYNNHYGYGTIDGWYPGSSNDVAVIRWDSAPDKRNILARLFLNEITEEND